MPAEFVTGGEAGLGADGAVGGDKFFDFGSAVAVERAEGGVGCGAAAGEEVGAGAAGGGAYCLRTSLSFSLNS